MRLSSLKLSGFKSFADSTTLTFNANRSAIVGPNGCGKSNIIDAIRWVMGESNARQLRGGSMQDVIFTGTAKRKAVGLASVELRFDNTFGKLGGTYNGYNELAIRRQINREGKSEYFLNGSKCRRRDITDIFLGTGLGPRSYAIIEQGMINRLIDAKPEEMRVFIEEAAGVSRYQVRRRETLLHLEHTRQNLCRLDDIAAELKGQLQTLKRQSASALHYKNLKAQIRSLNVEMLSFQCQQSTLLQQEYALEIDGLSEQCKAVRSELSTLEHDLTATQALLQQLIQQSSPLQNQWQQAEKKLSELNLTLQQKQSSLQQNRVTFTQLEQQKLHSKERYAQLNMQIVGLQLQQQQQSAQLPQQQSHKKQHQQSLNDLKMQQQQLQQQADLLKMQVEKQQQHKMQLLAQNEQLNKNIARFEQQKITLQKQTVQIQQQDQQNEIDQLQRSKTEIIGQIEHLKQAMQAQQQSLEQIQVQYEQQQNDISALKADRQILQVEQNHLKQLQLQSSPTVQQDAVQLMQVLMLKDAAKPHVDVIEKFLAKWLSAHIVDDAHDFAANISRQLKDHSIQPPIQLAGLHCLADWIESPKHSLWQQVAVADNLTQALSLQAQLSLGQSILTLDGYHVGAGWLIALFYDEASQAAQGVLSHAIRLDEIAIALRDCLAQLDMTEPQLIAAMQQSAVLQKIYQQQQVQLVQQQQSLQQTDIQLAQLQSHLQAFAVQKIQRADQLQQLNLQLEEDLLQKDDLEIDFQVLELKIAHNLSNYQAVQSQVVELQQQCEQMQQLQQQAEQALVILQHQNSQTQQQIAVLEKDALLLNAQDQQIIERIQQSEQIIQTIQCEVPDLEFTVQQQVKLSENLQNTWQKWQVELNHIQQQHQRLTGQRQQKQQQEQALRQQLEQSGLAWQVAKSDTQHYLEQLGVLNSPMISTLEIDLVAYQQQLQKAQQQFEQLGAVNFAAAQEYEEISTRFEELHHQMQDLEKTVDQLQGAMKSIDQETRKLFMATFNQINLELQDLFPKVFNGGEAGLMLEDDWQSGVKLMARPPGKRNSALALLSGGEKALTALALVFAIFRLNPAPFCVLDEVDAPLDDANVARFCNLVKELSEQVQFIYITHNKVAMTMASDLLGVTMPEPGTSKLVTVDLQQAKEYGLVAES